MTERSVPFGRRTFAAMAAVLFVCFFSVQCGQSPTGPTPSPAPTPTVPDPNTGPFTPPPVGGPVLFSGAGDIGECTGQPAATARMLENLGGFVFTTGDNAYPMGTASDFNCYDSTWGRPGVKERTFPVPGNHEYGDDHRNEANAYFAYFGTNAGPFGRGYYAYDVGNWRVIALNSNFALGYNGATSGGPAVGVGPASAQMAWLANELQTNHQRCVLAYWHHPLFTSGQNPASPAMRPIFKALYDANAELVLNGHDHIYERYAPQNADGGRDDARGIREFIVGTGGHPGLTPIVSVQPNSEVRITRQYGILKLTLNTDSYAWEFVTTTGAVLDSGTGSCH